MKMLKIVMLLGFLFVFNITEGHAQNIQAEKSATNTSKKKKEKKNPKVEVEIENPKSKKKPVKQLNDFANKNKAINPESRGKKASKSSKEQKSKGKM